MGNNVSNNELLKEIEALKAERDALLAQNKELGSLLVAAEKQAAQLTLLALGELSLNEIKAEAGRKGYLQGHLDALGDPDEIDKEHAAYRANEYAATVRKGGE